MTPPLRSLRSRLVGWAILIGLCLALTLGWALVERRSRALQRVARAEREQAECAANADREYRAMQRALAVGDKAAAARHCIEVNRFSAQADRLMRDRKIALDYW